MKKSYIILTFLATVFLATSLFAQDIKTDSLQYISTDKEITGYIAEPSTAGKDPALILIQEWCGLTADIKSLADKHAKLGFVALAVDLYKGKSADDYKEGQKLVASFGPDHAKGHLNHMRTDIMKHYSDTERVEKLSDVNQFKISLKNKGVPMNFTSILFLAKD